MVSACKNIIATGDSTAGDYNLLLKVRDPSRPGLQVLTHIPTGYEYNYHHPWTGQSLSFQVNHSYIGVSSLHDISPNIVKSGMVLTNAGLAYGDADSGSRWINPTQHAWDDFDWIRYSCEQADTETEAVHYLTVKAVDQLHATGVSENLCIIGPEKGYLIEADAYRYTVKEIKDDVDLISNYPRDLWNTQVLNCRYIADSYDASKIESVSENEFIRLNGIASINILNITNQSIRVKQFPFFTNIGYHDRKPSYFLPPETLNIGESKIVGDFHLSLLNITDDNAKIHLTTAVHAFEEELLTHITPRYGKITVKDMMNWSRLQAEDVNDVRPMCEATYPYEGVAIYQIPHQNYDYISKGWFSANHAVSSIYIPFHNSNTDIYKAFETGKAAQISLSLYQNHSDGLLDIIQAVEQVFFTENNFFDGWAQKTNQSKFTIANVLTTIDTTMQKQAWIMQKTMYNISTLENKTQSMLLHHIKSIWKENYSASILQMGAVLDLNDSIENNSLLHDSIIQFMQSTCLCYMNITKIIGVSINESLFFYDEGNQYLKQQQYLEAAEKFYQVITRCINDISLNQS